MARPSEELMIRMKHVGVARHQRKIFFPAVGVDDPCDFTVRAHDLSDLVIKTNFAAQLSKNRDERLDQRASTAFGKIDTPLALKTMNQRVDRCRGKRVAANEQRMKTEELA